MSLEKILSISGKPGLYRLMSQTKGHIIVESLEDGKRIPVTGAYQINALDNIAIYTYSEELPLSEVFLKIYAKENGQETISHKESGQKLLTYFEEVLPDYDKERVYASHIKKIIQWYHSLLKSNFDFSTLENNESQDDAS